MKSEHQHGVLCLLLHWCAYGVAHCQRLQVKACGMLAACIIDDAADPAAGQRLPALSSSHERHSNMRLS